MFKSYSRKNINKTITGVEKALDLEFCQDSFVEFDKLRYIRKKSILRYFLNFYRDGYPKTFKNFFSLNLKKHIKLFIRLFSKGVMFDSCSDVVHVRNNLSLFFLDKKERVKIFLGNQERNLENFVNEYVVRQKLSEIDNNLNVPALIGPLHEGDVIFFRDEIICGKMYEWDNPDAERVLKAAYEKLWDFYKSYGIEWRTLESLEIDVKDISSYISRREDVKSFFIESELTELDSFSDKYVPLSMIHGDFSLGNIMVSNGDYCVIDWELARYDLVIKDLYKSLCNLPSIIFYVDRLMNAEIEKQHLSIKENCLNLKQQMLLEKFLRQRMQ